MPTNLRQRALYTTLLTRKGDAQTPVIARLFPCVYGASGVLSQGVRSRRGSLDLGMGEFPSFLPNWFSKKDTAESPKPTEPTAAMWTNRTAGGEIEADAAEDQLSAQPLSPARLLDKQKTSSKLRTPRGEGAQGGIHHAPDGADGGIVRPTSTEGDNERVGIGL